MIDNTHIPDNSESAENKTAEQLWREAHDKLQAKVIEQEATIKKLQELIASMEAQPEQDCRIELVTAIHTLASHFENTLYAVQDDKEALQSAQGAIEHSLKIAAFWNWNGVSPAQPKAEPNKESPDVS